MREQERRGEGKKKGEGKRKTDRQTDSHHLEVPIFASVVRLQ